MRTFMTSVAVSALFLTASTGPSFAAVDAGDLPPNAVPGHCYGKMLIPEQ